MRILLFAAVVALFAAATPVRANEAENDAAMLKLATHSGCMACHSIVPNPKRADGLPPHRAGLARHRHQVQGRPRAHRIGSHARS